MKKFITYLTVLVSIAIIGFATYYLVQDKETFAISETIKYVMVGEEFEIDAIWENQRPGSDYDVFSTDSSIVDLKTGETNKFVAYSGGVASIYFRTTNPNYRNVSCRIFVGDGTRSNPFYISTPEQFLAIGDESIADNLFTLNKAYELLNNIDLTNQETGEVPYFTPIGLNGAEGFTGNFEGKGYTISNIKLNPDFYADNYNNIEDAGLFYTIGVDGRVANVKLENVFIAGENMGYVGAIAAYNFGTVERIEVKNVTISAVNTTAVGGAVGMNVSTELGAYNPEDVQNSDYTRKYARIDRVSVNMLIGAEFGKNEETNEYEYTNVYGTGGNVGGLVGENYAGIVVYSYAKGQVHLNGLTTNYGGIAGYNTYLGFATTAGNTYSEYTGGHIKDTYASIQVYTKLATVNPNVIVGGLIGTNNDRYATALDTDSVTNRIIGNYYDIEQLNIIEMDETMNAITKDYFNGIGSFLKDGAFVSNLDNDYVVLGETTTELQDQATYLSHVKQELMVVDGVQQSKETRVGWKFGALWNINPTINGGMPYLTYENIELTDDIYSVTNAETINNIDELMNMRLDGNYVLMADIYLDEETYNYYYPERTWTAWQPIGTIRNPFVGSLQAASYANTENGEEGIYTIYNLTLDGSTAYSNEYGGFFGVLSGENSGEIKNLVFENITSVGFKTSGGIVGTNGYSIKDIAGNPINEVGATIQNVTVRNARITGLKTVGGIAGVNYGNIIGSTITATMNETTNSFADNSILQLTIESNGYLLGGIAGINDGVISRSTVTGLTELKIESEAVFEGSVGGIAGKNESLINNVLLDGIKINISAALSGAFGGVAGVNTGSIVKSLLLEGSINASTENINVYVGGIAGRNIAQGSIFASLVESSGLNGYYVGGLVGEFQYNKSGDYFNYTFDDNNRMIAHQKNPISISQSGVKESAITGAMVGGIAGVVINGIISDVYAQVSLTGVNGETVKAGVVAEINFDKSGSNIIAGVIQNVYTVASFNGDGSNYAVSKSEFLKTPFIKNIPFTEIEFTRPAGFITNFMFNDSTDGNATKPQKSNVFEDSLIWLSKFLPFVDDLPESASSTDQLQTKSYYNNFNFDSSVWNIVDGKYAELKEIANLYDEITTVAVSFNASVDFTFVTSMEIKYETVSAVSYGFVNVPSGADLEFQIVPQEGYTLNNLVVRVNDVDLVADVDGFYSIENIYESVSISITYTKVAV